MAQLVKKELSTKSTNMVVSNSLSDLVSTKETQELIVKTLGKNRLQTFMGNVLTIAQDQKLADVEPSSLFNCLLKTAVYSFPLDSNIGYSYIIPYKNKEGIKIAQFQMGAKGFTELAYRTNKYTRLNVAAVKEGEYKGVDWFGEAEIQWSQSPDRAKKKTIGYVAAFELTNGMRKRVYWTVEKIQEHANKYSKAHQYALKSKDLSEDKWSTDFEAMAEKTVLKHLISKYGPKSSELRDALKFDQSVIERKNGQEIATYIDSDVIEDEIDTAKVYDIDTTTGEVKEPIVVNEKDVTPINTENLYSEEDDPNIKIILYSEYLKNQDIYKKENYPNGDKAYQVEADGRKTIRVRIKQ